MKTDNYHESVMIHEVLEALHVKNQALYIDATLGTGGHTLEISKLGGQVLGIEADSKMLSIAKERLVNANPTPKLVHGNFMDIEKIVKDNGYDKVSGILFDLGVSNLHLTTDDRGFSFSNPDLPLDMRLDAKTQGVSASDLLNALREDQLIDLFAVTMDPGSAKWIARRVVENRGFKTFEKVSDLLEICRELKSKPTLNSATLPFLALRIAVNSELDNLFKVLPIAYDLLDEGGRLVVISFHSEEDRIVKRFMANFGPNELILPSHEEIEKNPRSRSAKMRFLEKK
ncbi:MAG: 16S rRNA (cytosine(1402)-N(4))-methyltransferase RsmH [Microgenomates group bacterium]